MLFKIQFILKILNLIDIIVFISYFLNLRYKFIFKYKGGYKISKVKKFKLTKLKFLNLRLPKLVISYFFKIKFNLKIHYI